MFLRILSASLGGSLFVSFVTFMTTYVYKSYKGYRGKLFGKNTLINTLFQIPIYAPKYLYGYDIPQEHSNAWTIYIIITGTISWLITKRIVLKKNLDGKS